MKHVAVLMVVGVLMLFLHVEYVIADVTLFTPESENTVWGWKISGFISQKDLLAVQNIARQLRSKKRELIFPVILDSQGGDVLVAIEIGRQIRKMSATTLVGSQGKCYSACVFIYAGGIKRWMWGGEMGIHRPYSTQTGKRDYNTVQKEHRDMDKLAKAYLQEMNVLPALYDAMIAVPPDKLRILSDSEMEEFGLGYTDPVYQEIENASEAKRYNLPMQIYLRRKAQTDTSCREPLLAGQYEKYQQCKEAIMYGLSISEFARRKARALSVCNEKFPPPWHSEVEREKYWLCYSQIMEGREVNIEDLTETTLILSIIITWTIGLTPSLLIRYVFLKRPMVKKPAIITSAFFWFLNITILIAMGSKSKTHAVLLFIAYVSYWILRRERKGFPSQSHSTTPTTKSSSIGFENRQEYEEWKTQKIKENMEKSP